MNTFGDTDEGRARPSVWPVYVMSALVGLYTIPWLLIALLFAALGPGKGTWSGPRIGELSDGALQFIALLLVACLGLFGIITVYGASKLRPWGWWFVIVWLALYSAWVACFYALGLEPAPSWIEMLLGCVLLALIVWPLVTRRRLFFPPKPEGEG